MYHMNETKRAEDLDAPLCNLSVVVKETGCVSPDQY